VLYFSDCQAGAVAGCVPGNNGNAGTSPSAPRRDLTGIDVNALGANSQLLFACGGVWTNFNVQLRNTNVTATQPLTMDRYTPSWGCSTNPTLKSGSTFYAIQMGMNGDTVADGGYTFKNLKLDGGRQANSYGVHMFNGVRNVTMDGLEITGFAEAIHAEQTAALSNSVVKLLNSNIHHNMAFGWNGDADDLTIESTTFTQNNSNSQSFGNAIRLAGRGRNAVLRNNTITENSVNGGECDSENVVVNGKWNNFLFEYNKVLQTKANMSCLGLAIYPDGSGNANYFRAFTVRANVFSNLGAYSMSASAAPSIVFETNLVVHTLPQYHAAIVVHDREPDLLDDKDTGATVRNNTVYLSRPEAATEAIVFRQGAGTNLRAVSNLIYFGVGSSSMHYCFTHTAKSNYAAFDYNLCHHAAGNGAWSASYGAVDWAAAAGFDVHGLDKDPLFLAMPSAANGWNDVVMAPTYGALPEDYVPGGAGIDAGHPSLSSAKDRLGNARGAHPDIGTREQELDYTKVPAQAARALRAKRTR
jgi:hypothetical protein